MDKYFTRSQSFTPQVEGDFIVFPFASETPVDRGIGYEILSCNSQSINTERCSSAPLLWNHNRDKVLGKVESVWVDGQRSYCKVRWSKSPEAQQYRAEVEDGIISNVSCGYSVDDIKNRTPDPDSYTVTRWTPYEISLVSIPADHTVGVNRSFLDNMGKESTKSTMEDTITITREEILSEERQRIATINALATRHGFPELGQKLIEEGATIDAARAAYLDCLGSNQQPVAAPGPLGFSPKEERNYSIVKAINAAISNDWTKAGFERECSLEIAKRTGRDPKGFFVPVRDLQVRAPFAVGAAGTGGNVVQTDLLAQNFIDLLRNKTMVIQAGAMMLSGLQGNVAIPTQATAATTYWVDEAEALTQSEATFGQISLTPKTVGALSQFSRLMLLQPSIDIEQFIRNDFARIMALAIDLAALAGTAADGQPRGILNTSGIGSVALGTNGAAPTWDSIVNLCREIEVDNADTPNMRFMTNPKVKAKLMTTSKQSSGVEGNFILQDPGTSLMGYPLMVTNQVSSALTKGSGSNLSAMILGNWSDLIIGEWGVLEILPNPFGSGYTKGSVDIRVMQTLDIAVRYAQSFAAITDIVTT